jgi:hypothetical protein
MKKLTFMLAILALLAVPATALAAEPGNVWHVPGDFASIQAAVDNASDGDAVYVHEGAYNEAVTIDGTDVSLKAVGSVTLAPSSCTTHGDVITVYDAVATIDGFEVDASNCMSGIYARGSSSLGEASVNVTVQNNHVHDYWKNGITVNCDLATGTVRNNTVIGSGTGPWAQNGIQFGYGATGVVMRNLVDSNWYGGPDWTASGILVFEADEVTVQGNTVLDSETGVAVESWCWYEPSADNNKVVRNTIQGANWGVSVSAYGWGYSNCAPSAGNNKVVNNSITTSGGDTGIFVGAVDLTGDYTPSADNNKVIHNTISGYETPIDDAGTATKVHATVFGP